MSERSSGRSQGVQAYDDPYEDADESVRARCKPGVVVCLNHLGSAEPLKAQFPWITPEGREESTTEIQAVKGRKRRLRRTQPLNADRMNRRVGKKSEFLKRFRHSIE